MIIFKKFYDTSVAENGGGTDTAILEKPEIKETLVEAMA